MSISFRDVAEILKAIDESQADHIEIEVGEMRIAVRKRDSASLHALAPTETPVSKTAETRPVPASDQPAASQSPVASAVIEKIAPEGHVIVRSPMVGTFYRRPSPEEPPFVEIGSTIETGNPLCLIEVMKLYSTIEAPNDGTVVSIFAEDGQLVEFDQQLYLIKLK